MEEARLNRKVRNNFRELEYKSYQKKEKKILSKRWYLNSILSFLFFLIFEEYERRNIIFSVWNLVFSFLSNVVQFTIPNDYFKFDSKTKFEMEKILFFIFDSLFIK